MSMEAQATQFSADAGPGTSEKVLLINTGGRFKYGLEARMTFGPRTPS